MGILITNWTGYITGQMTYTLEKTSFVLRIRKSIFLFLFDIHLISATLAHFLSLLPLFYKNASKAISWVFLVINDWCSLNPNACSCFYLDRLNLRHPPFLISIACFLQIQQSPLQTVCKTGIILPALAKRELCKLPSNASRGLKLYRTVSTTVQRL